MLIFESGFSDRLPVSACIGGKCAAEAAGYFSVAFRSDPVAPEVVARRRSAGCLGSNAAGCEVRNRESELACLLRVSPAFPEDEGSLKRGFGLIRLLRKLPRVAGRQGASVRDAAGRQHAAGIRYRRAIPRGAWISAWSKWKYPVGRKRRSAAGSSASTAHKWTSSRSHALYRLQALQSWCARRDSNSRPAGSKPDALSG